MMDHAAAILALRQRLLTTVVATTGVTTLGASGNGYTRPNGSFIADGFKVGMEVVPAGFANNEPAIIRRVSANEIQLTTFHPEQPAEANRSLHVGIPLDRSWENVELTPQDGRWFIEEDYIPGPSTKIGVGQRSQLEHLPQYVLRLSGLAGYGIGALFAVAQGILDQFPPLLALDVGDGLPLRVSSETAPYAGQILPGPEAGRAEIVITIPLWKRTYNPI